MRQRIKYVTEEDKQKLLAAMTDPRTYTMFRLLFATGLRVNELVRLNVGHVRDHEILTITGKGGKEREIPLAGDIRRMLNIYLTDKAYHGEPLEDSAPLFYSRLHRRLGDRSVRYELKAYCRKAGLERMYSPHSCRHYVGFTLLKKTGNLRLVQEYLGHSRISTTTIYTQLTTDDLKPAAELLAA